MPVAVVNYAAKPGSVDLRDVPIPEIGDDDVLLAVANVGVCGSDLHQWTGDQSWAVNYPVVLGHEFGGHVSRCGAHVKGWKEGDRAVSETAAVIDAASPLTRIGRYNLDPSRRGFGYGVDGAMTQYVRVPARCLHRVPNALSFEQACLAEPCAVAYNAVVGNTRLKPGDRVVVLGPGTIGILCAALARMSGAEVAVVGLQSDTTRLAIARGFGCASIVGGAREWACERDGLGADVVVDAAGVTETLAIAIDLVRPAGWITKVGWGRDPVNVSLDPIVQKNVTLQGSFSHHWAIWERVISLLASGTLDVRPIIGGVWPVVRWREAFDAMHSRTIVKSVLTPVT